MSSDPNLVSLAHSLVKALLNLGRTDGGGATASQSLQEAWHFFRQATGDRVSVSVRLSSSPDGVTFLVQRHLQAPFDLAATLPPGNREQLIGRLSHMWTSAGVRVLGLLPGVSRDELLAGVPSLMGGQDHPQFRLLSRYVHRVVALANQPTLAVNRDIPLVAAENLDILYVTLVGLERYGPGRASISEVLGSVAPFLMTRFDNPAQARAFLACIDLVMRSLPPKFQGALHRLLVDMLPEPMAMPVLESCDRMVAMAGGPQAIRDRTDHDGVPLMGYYMTAQAIRQRLAAPVGNPAAPPGWSGAHQRSHRMPSETFHVAPNQYQGWPGGPGAATPQPAAPPGWGARQPTPAPGSHGYSSNDWYEPPDISLDDAPTSYGQPTGHPAQQGTPQPASWAFENDIGGPDYPPGPPGAERWPAQAPAPNDPLRATNQNPVPPYALEPSAPPGMPQGPRPRLEQTTQPQVSWKPHHPGQREPTSPPVHRMPTGRTAESGAHSWPGAPQQRPPQPAPWGGVKQTTGTWGGQQVRPGPPPPQAGGWPQARGQGGWGNPTPVPTHTPMPTPVPTHTPVPSAVTGDSGVRPWPQPNAQESGVRPWPVAPSQESGVRPWPSAPSQESGARPWPVAGQGPPQPGPTPTPVPAPGASRGEAPPPRPSKTGRHLDARVKQWIASYDKVGPRLLERAQETDDSAKYGGTIKILSNVASAFIVDGRWSDALPIVTLLKSQEGLAASWSEGQKKILADAIALVLPPEGVEQLVQALPETEVKDRAALYELIAAYGAQAVPALLNLFTSRRLSPVIRREVTSLVEAAGPHGGAAILEAIRRHGRRWNRVTPLIGLLGAVGYRAGQKVIVEYLRHARPNVREEALVAIYKMLEHKAQQYLLDALDDADTGVCQRAVALLAAAGSLDPGYTALLYDLVGIETPQDAREEGLIISAVMAIRSLGNVELVENVDAESALVEALRESVKSGFLGLGARSQGRPLGVQTALCDALGAIGGERSLGALSTVGRDAPAALQSAAAMAVSRLRARAGA